MLKWVVIWLVCCFIISASLAVIQQFFKNKKVSSDGMYTIISFERFLKFYNMAPKTWYLSSDYVTKYANDGGVRRRTSKEFSFTGADMVKYRKWKRKTTTENKYNEDMAWLAREVKKDIESFETKNKETTDELLERLVKERMEVRERFLKMNQMDTASVHRTETTRLCDSTGKHILEKDVVKAVYPDGRKLYGFAKVEDAVLKLMILDSEGDACSYNFIRGESAPIYTVIGNITNRAFDDIVKADKAMEEANETV